jgi:hypothetical protein
MSKKLVNGSMINVKDDSGAYLPSYMVGTASQAAPKDVSIDSILERQLQALDECTTQLLGKAKSGFLTKDEIASLATCLKITIELKERENDLLKNLSDEDLKKLIDKKS